MPVAHFHRPGTCVDAADGRLMPVVMAMIVVASLAAHLCLVAVFPTQPVSDFAVITKFATAISQHGIAAEGTFWQYMNAGLPMMLAFALKVTGGEAERVARLSTAIVMSLVPLLPLLILRGAVPAGARLLAAGALGFLPMLLLFCGVVAQDNWVVPPMIALACMAIRNYQLSASGRPIIAATLWCLAVYIRQEMLLVALPMALLAAYPFRDGSQRRAALVRFSVAALVLLCAIAAQRGAATGHFRLSTSHGGHAVLGSYVPGARFSWAPPQPYLAAHDPEKGYGIERLREDGMRLALGEIGQRPMFHLVRRAGATLHAATGSDLSLQGWALTNDGVLPEDLRPAARRLAFLAGPTTQWTFVLLHALFLAALPIAWRARDPAMLAICLTIAMKVGIHMLVSLQARFFLVVTALEVIVIVRALLYLIEDAVMRRLFVFAFAVFAAGLFLVWRALPSLAEWVDTQESKVPNPHYQFSFATHGASARCHVERGRVTELSGEGLTLRLMQKYPQPGDTAEVTCELPANGTPPLRLEIEDRYSQNLADRIVQQVSLAGRPIQSRDIGGQDGVGWWGVDLPRPTATAGTFSFRLIAVKPDAYTDWGHYSTTKIRLVPAK